DAYTVPSARERGGLEPCQVLPPLLDALFRPPADRGAARAALGWSGEPLVGMVSAFQPSRRHALGIEAFALVLKQRPRARLILIGEGGLEAELRAKAAGLGSAVTFAGYHARAEFSRRLSALDEVWLLGLGNDWSARAAAQARACGVRVVAVDEG